MKNPDGSRLAKQRAKCFHCPHTYLCDTKSNGTSNMRNHLFYHCKKCPLYIPSKKQKNLVWDSAENEGKLIAKGFNEDVAKLALARMVVRDELPFSFIEGD
ncbi:uncharacterized protein LOC126795342 [Argentina anserina]|uniref:uncharacterized protein LOC126795342 n=1 Tax=Argentina anserina TaxID=57926 RepID=UPI0021762597|nr:uncharacterized protein LOC126795342 [Potentilla anserina]